MQSISNNGQAQGRCPYRILTLFYDDVFDVNRFATCRDSPPVAVRVCMKLKSFGIKHTSRDMARPLRLLMFNKFLTHAILFNLNLL